MLEQDFVFIEEEVALLDDLKNKKKDLMWELAYNAAWGNTAEFISYWEKHKKTLTLGDLRQHQNHLTVLWLLTLSLMKGYLANELFEEIWQKHKAKITLSDLQGIAQEGENEGISMLWMFALLLAQDRSTYFVEIWQKFALSAKDLQTCAQQGNHQGKTIWWWLTYAHCYEGGQLWPAVWKTTEQISAEDMRAQARYGIDSGKTLWWLLAYALFQKNAEASLLWQKLAEKLTLEDIRSKAHHPNSQQQNQTVLWLISAIAVEQPHYLQHILSKFKDKLKVEDLCTSAQTGKYKGTSVLYYLIKAAIQHDTLKEDLTFILKRCANPALEKAFYYCSWDEKSIEQMMAEINHPWVEQIRDILSPSSTFRLLLKDFQYTQEYYQQLEQSAQQVFTRGHVSAYYELGQTYQSKNLFAQAVTAFHKIPSADIHHFKQKAQLIAQASYKELNEALHKIFNRPRTYGTDLVPQLYQATQTLFEAGYQAAFIDLGHFLKTKQWNEEAIQAWKKIAVDAPNYQQAQQLISHTCEESKKINDLVEEFEEVTPFRLSDSAKSNTDQFNKSQNEKKNPKK